MATGTQGQHDALSSLNMAIGALNRAKGATNVTPAKAAFTSAGVLLTMIRNSMANKADYVKLGLTCADACEALSRRIDGRRADQLSRPFLEAIEKLTGIMDEIQTHITRRGRRNPIFRRCRAKADRKAISTWKLDLDGILGVFNIEPEADAHPAASDTHQDATNKPAIGSGVANTHIIDSDIHRNKLKGREGVDGRDRAAYASAPGESTPPPLGNTHGTASDIHQDVANTRTVVNKIHNILRSQEGAGSQPQLTQNRLATSTAERSSVPGELPPPPPGVFFGRDELVEKIVGFTQRLTSIALIGAGGIGKTSTVLTVLHDDRIKQKFGDDRRFIRCDKFTASHTHFLRHLSRAIGAGIENPEDLTPLRRYLSSKEMLVVLDNAESILDPQGSSAQEIYAVVDELSRFSNICLCITSRISTIPPHCETLHIPTLSMEAGCDTFYRIYKHGERSDSIDGILKQLDFHPLSITLLATVAQYNTWDASRLSREWGRQGTGVLHAQHSGSLAATIELSLASPMFCELGPDARGLLGVIAFFPQGVNEENIDWLFPTIPDGPSMFDAFCTLSLTYRSNGFITMLAPLRDHLCPKDHLRPKDPTLSPLLTTTKECYFSHMSTYIYPGKPGFEESRWIMSEDVNIEHLLNILTSMDASSEVVWDASSKFMNCLFWHKPRFTMLGPKIEALPDDHPTKLQCLYDLSRLFYKAGNSAEQKRLLTHCLKLSRERGDDFQFALKLRDLCQANRLMGLYKEGIQQVKEAIEIFEQLGDTVNQAECWVCLAYVLGEDEQFDAAEEAASRAIDLLPEEGEQYLACLSHRVLGNIYGSKGDTEKAIRHFEIALEIASSLGLDDQLFWVHFNLAQLFLGEGKFDDAHTHIENAESHAISGMRDLGLAMGLQAEIWYNQGMFEKARSGVSHAADVFEKLGATRDLESCREGLRQIDEKLNSPVVSDEPDIDGPGN